MKLTVGILVISDTASADNSTDKAIPVLSSIFENPTNTNADWDIVETRIVPDHITQIQSAIKSWSDQKKLNLVVTSGGTGFAVKDFTPEAVKPLLTKEAPGIVHGMMTASLNVTPFAMMSRPVAGLRHQTMIITLPGSPKGAKENLEAVIKLLPHACVQAAGGDSRTIHSGGVKKLEKEAGVASNAFAQPQYGEVEHEEVAVSHHPLDPHNTEGRDSTIELSHEKIPDEHEKGASHHPLDPHNTIGWATKEIEHDTDHEHHHHQHHTHNHDHSHSIPRPHTKQQPDLRSNSLSDSVVHRHRASPYPMLSVSAAKDLVYSNMPKCSVITKSVNEDMVGYILASDVYAAESVPAFRASIVDGYAVHHTDGKGIYPVVSISHAAPGNLKPLEKGQITRITTGAPLPEGATAVVMVEDTKIAKVTDDGKEELEVEILAGDIKEMENVREVGSDMKVGDLLLKAGAEITPVGGEVGLLASVGIQTVEVFKKPVVGVLSTGDEVVDHNGTDKLRHGQIRDSNRPTLLAAIKARGYTAVDLGIVADSAKSLEDIIKDSLKKCDVIITTGGVSMGEKDLLKPTIERTFNGSVHFGRVTMKPGKPTTFATIPFKNKHSPIFSLPGNPASATVTFHLFVLPALRQMSGFTEGKQELPTALVTVEHDVPLDSRPEFHRAVVRIDRARANVLLARSTGMQRSSRIGSLEGANALLCLPAKGDVGDKRTRIPMGDNVEAILIGDLKI